MVISRVIVPNSSNEAIRSLEQIDIRSVSRSLINRVNSNKRINENEYIFIMIRKKLK